MQKRLGRQTVVFEAPPRIAAGASIVGGCCGTTPAHIGALADAVKKLAAPKSINRM